MVIYDARRLRHITILPRPFSISIHNIFIFSPRFDDKRRLLIGRHNTANISDLYRWAAPAIISLYNVLMPLISASQNRLHFEWSATTALLPAAFIYALRRVMQSLTIISRHFARHAPSVCLFQRSMTTKLTSIWWWFVIDKPSQRQFHIISPLSFIFIYFAIASWQLFLILLWYQGSDYVISRRDTCYFDALLRASLYGLQLLMTMILKIFSSISAQFVRLLFQYSADIHGYIYVKCMASTWLCHFTHFRFLLLDTFISQ